jgi:hypothetical protein
MDGRKRLRMPHSKLPDQSNPLGLALANIQAVIDGGGQIMIGPVAPIRGAAVVPRWSPDSGDAAPLAT